MASVIRSFGGALADGARFEASLDRETALKVVPKGFLSDPTRRQRSIDEARNMARGRHPNVIVVDAFDLDETGPAT